MDKGCLCLVEHDVLVELAEERRLAVEAVSGAALMEDETAVAKVFKIIIEAPTRYIELVGKLLGGIAPAAGEKENEVELTPVFVQTHGI